MKKETNYIIDFDSTLVRVEALDELARISLAKSKRREKLLQRVEATTNMGMDGSISIRESLERRLKLINANRSHLKKLVETLKKKITYSFLANKKFFKENSARIYIITSGFSEYVVPVAEMLGVHKDKVLANSFIFDKQGTIVGFDRSNVLSQEGGKVKAVQALKLKGPIHVIGDGYTDYQIREHGAAQRFFAFTENVCRDKVVSKADEVVKSFDEFLYLNKLPMAVSYPKSKIRALLLEGISVNAAEALKKEGFAVETVSEALGEDELCSRIKDVALLGIRSKTKVTAKVLREAKRLMAIGAFCIGTDQLELSACTRKGVVVFNAPYSNTRSVVELVLGEIIMLMRRTFEASHKLHQGIWHKSAAGSYEVRGKRLGIVGYGNIGSQLSVLAESLGMEVYFYDVVEKLALGNAKRCRTMAELLKRVDVVTVHIDGRASNKNLIGQSEFSQMREGAIFLNLSRGFVVDLAALVKALKSGKICGAAIDVFPEEPESNKQRFVSDLQGLPNVILTPHVGGSTSEAQENIAEYVAGKFISYVNEGGSFFSVNFPQIQLPTFQKAHRLLHIHNNVPGILAKINGVLAANKINILGQYLKTNEEIGYVITDVNKTYNKQVIEELKTIPDTIKFRVLY